LREKYAPQSYFIALLATTLWAINPIQTQAVTYIVQRMASLAGMFYIMSMFFYLKARISETGSKKIIFFILCFVSFLMALGSKENAAILPLSIFLYEIVILHEDAGLYLRRNRGVFLVVCGGTLLLGLLYMYFKGGNIFSFLNTYENRPFTLTQRLLTQPRIIIFYFSLLLYPVPNRLSIAHSFQVSTSLFDPISTIFSILLISAAIAFAIYSAKKNPLFSFCILFFFLNHAIESSIFALELIFEHRNYIPSMLFFLPIAIGFYNLLQLYTKKKAMKHITSAFIILLLIGIGHATFMRNLTWKNERSLWMDAIEKSPDLSRPHHNLGRYYHDHGHKNEAILEYQKAIEKPVTNRIDETSVTYYNLAKIYSDFKDYEKALYHYYKALFINPQFPPIYNDIAGVFDRQGKYELAYRYLVEAFRLRPYSTVTNFNLGLYYLRERQPEKAIYHLQSLSDEKEFGDKVLIYLGVAFKQKGQLGRAVTYFKKALKANPRNIKLYLHLAEISYRIGDIRRAQHEVEKAIGLIPDTKTFQNILDALLTEGRSRNLQPRADIVIPLMRECCRSKSETLKEWSELLNEKFLRFEGE